MAQIDQIQNTSEREKRKKKKLKADENKGQREACANCIAPTGARTHVTNPKMHTSYIWTNRNVFKRKKHHALHMAHARVTNGTNRMILCL